MTSGSVRTSDPFRSRPDTPTDFLAESPDHPVTRAAHIGLDAFRDEAGDALDADETRDLMGTLAARICWHAGHRSTPPHRPPKAVLTRRLLEHLRAALVRQFAEDTRTSRDELVTILAAAESVREEIDPNWAEHFQARLTGPDALELVVEVAHDLRSPLTSILFLAETLQRGSSGPVNEIQSRQLGLIYGAALGLSSVTSDVMELARGGDRLVDKDPSPFSVAEIFESVRDVVHPIAAEKGLDISLEPPTSDHRLGHPMALSRVLLNLTTNALKFTDEGSVTISGRSSGMQELEFSVRDTGHGIPPEAIRSLYQPFRRTTAHQSYAFSGTGLGLAICRKLVEAMGSSLEVETDPSWGTRFYFVLPLPPAGHL